jgi:molybdenum cofactor guanylyltransferase
VKLLGAIVAGGASTRYGTPKALASVGGQRVVDRVHDALRTVTTTCVAIVNDASIAREIGLASRPDVVSGAGVLGGLLTALQWARERDDDAILAVGCDMPFLAPSLLAALRSRFERGGCDAVLPESRGPRGVEPLCAVYGPACLPAIEAALDRGDRRMIAFHRDVRVARIALDDVARHGNVDRLFFNINTPESRALAERMAQAAP